MKIADFENLGTSEEMKAARAAFVAEQKDAPELAARYAQARIDAKQRDEKLAEQGVTITSLNAALTDHRKAITEAAELLKKADAQLAANQEAAAKSATALEAAQSAMLEVSGENARLTALAAARRTALVDVLAHANGLAAKVAPLLAAE